MNNYSKRWIYLLAGIVIELCIGIGYAWSVFQNPIVSKFGWTTASVSIAFTLSTAMGVFAPLVGKLQEYLKPKQIVLIGAVIYGSALIGTGFIKSILSLYIIYGMGVGLGMSMVYPLVISYMVKMFPHKRGLVSGLMVASYGAGAMIWAPVGAGLATNYGVLNAFKILGIFFLIVISVFSRFLGDVPEDATRINTNNNKFKNVTAVDKTWKEMLKTPKFYTIFIMFVIGTTAGLMILGHASPIVQEVLKTSPQKAAFAVGVLAAANAFGRLLWGGLSDKLGRYPILIGLFTLVSVALFTLAVTNVLFIYLGSLIVVELCYGGFISLIAPITADTFGAKHMSINYGIMFVAFAFGGIVGPRVAAVVKEANNGSYDKAFVIAATMCLVGLVIAIYLRFENRKSELKS